MNPYIVILIAGMMGIITHVAMAMYTINKSTPGINLSGVWKQYWKTDTISVILSIIVLVGYTIIVSEWVDMNKLEGVHNGEPVGEMDYHSKLAGFIKTISYFIGLLADYLIYKVCGKAKKVIDKKLSDEDWK